MEVIPSVRTTIASSASRGTGSAETRDDLPAFEGRQLPQAGQDRSTRRRMAGIRRVGMDSRKGGGVMLSPRLTRLDLAEDELNDLRRRRSGMFATGKLISVDEFSGECKVLLFGRGGDTALLHGCGALFDDPENAVGLTCKLLIEAGVPSEGGVWVMGAVGPIAPLLDTQNLAPGAGVLEARDRRIGPSVRAWEGQGTVEPGRSVVINAVRIVIPSATSISNGVAAMVFSGQGQRVVFRERSRDSVILVLEATKPFRVVADSDSAERFDVYLGVDRTAGGIADFADATLACHYVVEAQPDSQRLQLTTTSGAGLPVMAIRGRTG